MKLKVHRRWLEIIPENEIDEAYIEEVLGLRKDRDVIWLVRENAFALTGGSHMGSLRTRRDNGLKYFNTDEFACPGEEPSA